MKKSYRSRGPRYLKCWLSVLLLGGMCNSISHGAPEIKPSKQHFAFVDYDFIFTLELVRPGVPILNFVVLGKGQYYLKAEDIRVLSGIKLYRPRLLEVDTASVKDPMRINSLQVHPRSSFGVTLVGDFVGVQTIDKVSVKLGSNFFQLHPLDAATFETLAKQVNQLNLQSPDIREDFRVLDIRPLGRRQRTELR